MCVLHIHSLHSGTHKIQFSSWSVQPRRAGWQAGTIKFMCTSESGLQRQRPVKGDKQWPATKAKQQQRES